jgi:hypothetical protein
MIARWAILVGLLTFAASISGSTAQNASPYAGQERRSVKALSDTEMRDLAEGRGMGLAKAAELNSYPGPMHVLALASELRLSEEQRAATEQLITGMRERATALGAQIIMAEQDLDRAFADRSIEPTYLADQVNTIAILQGRLRTTHLLAHLRQRAVLGPEQVARYNELRGYQGAVAPSDHHQHMQ